MLIIKGNHKHSMTNVSGLSFYFWINRHWCEVKLIWIRNCMRQNPCPASGPEYISTHVSSHGMLWFYPAGGIQTGQNINIVTAALCYHFNKQRIESSHWRIIVMKAHLLFRSWRIFDSTSHACLPADEAKREGLGVFPICIYIYHLNCLIRVKV